MLLCEKTIYERNLRRFEVKVEDTPIYAFVAMQVNDRDSCRGRGVFEMFVKARLSMI